MREDRSPLILLILLLVSLGLHGVAFIGLRYLSLATNASAPSAQIAFVVETPELPPLPPEPEEEPPPPPPPPPPSTPPPRPLVAASRVRPTPPDAPPPPPLEETPVAFDNVTLTNDAPSSFTMQQSSGVSREGPIGPPGEPTGRRVLGTRDGVPGGTGVAPAPGTRIVSAANLSRRPRPPSNADAILERYFPSEERDQGIEGEASVRVMLGPDGRATNVRIISSSRASFGNACRRMFRDPQMAFTPPLDAQGNPVSTQIDFNCSFDMNF